MLLLDDRLVEGAQQRLLGDSPQELRVARDARDAAASAAAYAAPSRSPASIAAAGKGLATQGKRRRPRAIPKAKGSSHARRPRSRSPRPSADSDRLLPSRASSGGGPSEFERLIADAREQQDKYSSERLEALRDQVEIEVQHWTRRAAEWVAKELFLDGFAIQQEVAKARRTCEPDLAEAVRLAGRAALERLRFTRAAYLTRAAAEARAAAEGLAAAEAAGSGRCRRAGRRARRRAQLRGA